MGPPLTLCRALDIPWRPSSWSARASALSKRRIRDTVRVCAPKSTPEVSSRNDFSVFLSATCGSNERAPGSGGRADGRELLLELCPHLKHRGLGLFPRVALRVLQGRLHLGHPLLHLGAHRLLDLRGRAGRAQVVRQRRLVLLPVLRLELRSADEDLRRCSQRVDDRGALSRGHALQLRRQAWRVQVPVGPEASAVPWPHAPSAAFSGSGSRRGQSAWWMANATR